MNAALTTMMRSLPGERQLLAGPGRTIRDQMSKIFCIQGFRGAVRGASPVSGMAAVLR